MKPSNVILMGGKKRTGKSHILVLLTWYAHAILDAEVLTNMVFKQRQPDGKFKLAYPPGVTYCNTLLDVMIHTARIVNTTNKNIVIVMDEIQNFMSAYEWNTPMGRDFVIYLGIISKLRQTYILATPDIKMFPRGIRDPDADVATALFYKDIEHTYDFNAKAGATYRSKEIVFLERPGCKKEVWEIGVCPWARDESTVLVGEFVYDHLVPGSRFSLGTIGDYTFDFRDVIAKVEHTIAEEIPGKLVEYVREIKAYERYLSLRSQSRQSGEVESAGEISAAKASPDPTVVSDEEIAVTSSEPPVVIQSITGDEDKKTKKQLEADLIIPYLALYTNFKPSELVGRGFQYSDTALYTRIKKARRGQD